jgi:cell division protein FtsB
MPHASKDIVFVCVTLFVLYAMKIITIILLIFIGQLQYRLWFGDGSFEEIENYQKRLDELKVQVEEKKHRNAVLYAEVLDMRKGQEAIEERARYELGMIREGETYIQVVE